MTNRHICPICKQSLRLSPCLTCGGTGTTTRFLFIKRPCTTCEGSGKQLRCPDLEAHLVEGGSPISTSTSEICPVCKGGGFLRIFTVSGGTGGARCAYCGGSGLVSKNRRSA